MKRNQNQKQVGITPTAHKALGDLRAAVRTLGVPLTRGAIVSQLILAARPEDVCRGK